MGFVIRNTNIVHRSYRVIAHWNRWSTSDFRKKKSWMNVKRKLCPSADFLFFHDFAKHLVHNTSYISVDTWRLLLRNTCIRRGFIDRISWSVWKRWCSRFLFQFHENYSDRLCAGSFKRMVKFRSTIFKYTPETAGKYLSLSSFVSLERTLRQQSRAKKHFYYLCLILA